jgi:tetratricopeptide (TPR) repeat protein
MSIKNNINKAEVLYQQGKYKESSEICEKLLAKKKNLFDALQIQGLNYQAQGQLTEAINFFERALSVKPSHATTHNNLGNAYLSLQNFKRASQSYIKALSIEPLMPQANNNLAICFVKLSEPERAEGYYRKAILLDPTIAEFYVNLGVLLTDRGVFSEASTLLLKALTLDTTKTSVYWHIFKIQMYLHRYRDALEIADSGLLSGSLKEQELCELLIGKAMVYWLFFRYEEAAQAIALSEKIYEFEHESPNMANMVVFHRYLKRLLKQKQQPSNLYVTGDKQVSPLPELYFLSESHGFSPNGTVVRYQGSQYQINSLFVLGAKLFHLIEAQDNKYQVSVSKVLEGLPVNSKIVLGFGEIDCRYNEGIYIHCSKIGVDYHQVIDDMVSRYLNTIKDISNAYQLDIIIYGVPSPHIFYVGKLKESEQQNFKDLVAYFNEALKRECENYHVNFLDVYQLTNDNGMSNLKYHLDGIHLEPKTVPELFERLKG